ncbi:hypothetical protein EB796_024234 [Bugula neritina]|uniref:Caspase family p20 domain-containing protein n=1 Tax=Bugula neritina TaxID=10212 RepID=A0A7J7IUG5_BUGNE|nr:hypothetical protein EB796_024234 [Bugula neritina]
MASQSIQSEINDYAMAAFSSSEVRPSPARSSGLSYIDIDEGLFSNRKHKKKKKIALIINISRFTRYELPNRPESDEKRDKLIQVARFLGFKDIRVSENLIAQQIIELLTTIASDTSYDLGTLLIFFLTYGTDKYIHATDKTITYNTLKEPLKHVNMKDAFKLLFVFACPPPPHVRVPELDWRLAVNNLVPRLRVEYDATVVGPRRNYQVYEELDFLLAYSVYKEFDFMDALTTILLRDGKKLDILTLLARTHRMMRYGLGAIPATCQIQQSLPFPRVISTLTSTYYFF